MKNFFAHAQALVESENIGKDTRIWAFAHVLPKAVIGSECNICDGVFVENDVILGDRVTVKCGVQLWDGLRIEDDVFIGPNATLTNDLFPRSKAYPSEFKMTILKKGCSIGANATILPGLTIGEYAMIGAGAVVTKDVPAYAKVVGNPGKVIGYVNSPDNEKNKMKYFGQKDFKVINDARGSLMVGEFSKDVPFFPKRFFVISGVPTGENRGAHAHFKCEQHIVVLQGSVEITLDNGSQKTKHTLNAPQKSLYVPIMTWNELNNFSSDAIVIVFASDFFMESDYIRDYKQFSELTAKR